MDESRQNVYLYLIQELLKCSPGSEQAVLNDNRDLLDAGLVQMMGQIAEALAERGDRSTTERLMILTRQLAEALGLSSSTPAVSPFPNFNSQLDFLLQVLQVTAENQGNPQALYLLLQGNLNLLDDNFAQVLENWATDALSAPESEEARRIAGNINNFCNHIAQFPQIRPENQWEIVITGYKVATTVFTPKASPKDWLMLQNGLGIAYRNQERIDEAIATLESALEIYSPEVFCNRFPEEWANLQNSLGNAYYSRSQIQEDKLQDLDLAISCYEEALQSTPNTIYLK